MATSSFKFDDAAVEAAIEKFVGGDGPRLLRGYALVAAPAADFAAALETVAAALESLAPQLSELWNKAAIPWGRGFAAERELRWVAGSATYRDFEGESPDGMRRGGVYTAENVPIGEFCRGLAAAEEAWWEARQRRYVSGVDPEMSAGKIFYALALISRSVENGFLALQRRLENEEQALERKPERSRFINDAAWRRAMNHWAADRRRLAAARAFLAA